jgi:hypothetical protein
MVANGRRIGDPMLLLTVTNIVGLGPVSRLPASVLVRIKSRLTFPNPAHLEAQRRGFSTWNIPQQIQGYRVEADVLIIPRGFIRELVGILRDAAVQYRIEDRRLTLPPVDFQFQGQLLDFQEVAVSAMAGTTAYGG